MRNSFHFRRSRTLLGGVLFLGTLGLTISAQGQPRIEIAPVPPLEKPAPNAKDKKDDRDWTEAITLPVEREARNKIEAVQKYLNGKEAISPKLWDDIIAVLQGMLADPTDKFVEVSDGAGKPSKVSVKIEVNRIIGTFNDDGRQFYQRIIGPDAEDKLKRAIEESDMGLMAEVSQRFLHTKAGAEATIRLGTWHLDRGRYQQAARTFKDLLLRNPKDELPPQLLFKAALAYKRQGADPEFAKAAQKYWDMFEKASGKAKVTFGSKVVEFDQLKAEYDRALVAKGTLFSNEWIVFRGDPTNNGQGKGGTPFLEPRFTYNIINPTDDLNYETKKSGFEIIKDRIDKALKQMETKGQAPIPGSFPLASNGKIIFRGYDGIYCVASKDNPTIDPPLKAGELLWKSNVDMGLWQMIDPLGFRAMTDTFLNFYNNSGPHSMLFANSLLGTMSHDGNNLYFVDDMAIPPHPMQFNQMNNFDGRPVTFGQFQDSLYFSRLKALNLETGKLMWKIGERTPNAGNQPAGGAPVRETTETLLADCLFLGPPLPLGGKLYIVIEKDGDLRLVCLDTTKLEPSTRQTSPVPSLVWSQALGQPNGRLPNDSLRRHQAIHLAYADGMLIVPTNAGAVLGVDLFSHSLVWAANYKSNKTLQQPPQEFEGKGFRRPQPFPGNGMMGNGYDTSRERWHASAPIVSNGKVIFTAFDSDTVECVDLQDGRTIWRSPISKQDGDLYVAGVFDDKLMIAGKGYVRFHSLATGAQLKEPLVTGIPTGVGVATKDLYYIPVKAAKDKSTEPGIVAIDTKNMLIKGTTRSRKKETAGNLLFYDGDVYSQGIQNIASFPQLDQKIKETQERLAKNNNDPIGLLDLAMLEHDDGRLTAAITNYRKALNNKPNEDTRAKGREKLFEAITELLQSDFSSGESMLDEYKKLCEVEIPEGATEAQRKTLAEEELRRKSNFFCLVAKGKETQGKLLDAFENYMAFGTLVGNREMVNVIDEPNTNARPDVWARGRIQNMIKKAKPEQRKPLEDKVREEWARVKDANDLEKLRAFVRVFGGMFDAGTESRILLADKLAGTGNEEDIREAEYMLFAMRSTEEPAAAAKATECLARLYIRKGLLDDAVGMYEELGLRFPKEVIKDGKTGTEMLTDLQTDKRFLPYLETPNHAWTYKRLRGSEVANTAYNPMQNTMAVDLPNDVLPFFKRNRLVIDMNGRGGQGWTLRVIDRQTGTDVFNSPGFGYPQWQYLFQQNNIPYKLVQVKGHIAVVTMHGNHPQTGQQTAKAYAYDLSEKSDKKKLWEVDLFGTNSNPLVLQQGAINQGIETDGIRVTFQDGWSMKVGQQWVVESVYSVVLTRDGLVAKDNARGTTLWTKSGVSSRTNMIGDAEHIFTYEASPDGNVSMVRCYRAADGVEVVIPDSSLAFTSLKRSKFIGRQVLTGDDTPGKKSIRLYDLYTGKDVWKRDIAGDGWMMNSQMEGYTGFVSTNGDVMVISTVDGKEVFKAKLDESVKATQLEKLAGVTLFGDSERFFVMLNKANEKAQNFNGTFTLSINSVKANGTMYAFNRATAKRLWYSEDQQLVDQNIVTNQFSELPIIIAANQFQKINANGNFEGQFMKLIAIDKDTGKAKFAKSGLSQGQFYSLITDAKAGTIEILNHNNVRIRFSPDDGKNVSTAPPSTEVPQPMIGGGRRVIVAPGVIVAPQKIAPPPVIID